MFTLEADPQKDPELAIATVINGVVCDLLHVHGYGYAHFPEFVDMATIATGLGQLQSNMDFVKSAGTFWDSSQWRIIPRPFLDSQSVAYINAVAAWSRNEKDPAWAEELNIEIRKPMLKSLKFLHQSKDCFFQPQTANQNLLQQSQAEWIEMTGDASVSRQVIAVRHLHRDETLLTQQQDCLAEKLRSTHHAVLVNAISASEQIGDVGQTAIEELCFLTQHRDNEIRAKAMCALTRLGQLNAATIATAGEMLGSKTKYVVYAGLTALSSLDSISEQLIPPINRSFIRALQVCDYEFVGLFAAAYTKWLDDPKSYVENLLRDDGPEYMEIAMEAIDNGGEHLVNLTA